MLDEHYKNMVKSRIIGRSHEVLDRQITECLKYLAIVSMTTGRRIPVTPAVDDVWHELILQTRSYRELCRTFPGAKFLDHESIDPLAYNERVGESRFIREWVQWVPDYVQSFGRFTPETAQHWNVMIFLQDELGMSLDEINELGETTPSTAVVPTNSLWSRLS